ncbi:hypothetical protein [Algicola sagamiensis]|uniref:hypothetical protein n=1 Tax=Algicola sagamiensis TaxID=163869 RepID=UPI0003A1A276|nr:hypothetical protein [Algicola sagamiensis]
MTMTQAQSAEELITLILKYLHQHPNSEDTLEGITEWWVRKQRIDDSRVAVDEALQRLTSLSLISATTRNNITYYKLK